MKNSNIQILRAIAIIAVVLIHTCPSGLPQVFIRPFINFGVAAFLFLSGYLTDISKIETKQFYKKRILRVIIPYIIWSIIYTTVKFVGNGDFNIKQYAINLLTADSAATLYYIFVYIQFVLLTPLLGKLLHKKYWWIGFLVTPLALVLRYYWLFNGVTVPGGVVSVLWDNCCLAWFVFYYLGLYLKNIAKRRGFDVRKLGILYLLAIVFQIFEGYAWYMMGDTNFGTQIKLSSIITSLIFVLLAYCFINNGKYKGKNKLLIKVGDYSFGIYLTHLMVIRFLSAVIPFWTHIPFVLNSFITLGVSLLFVLIGEKLCGEKVSKYLGLR